MIGIDETRPSLENLVESENLGFEILHPGSLEITQELAGLCNIEKGTYVLDIASGTGETTCYLAEKLGARVVGVDGSDLMIERAREKPNHIGISIEFQKGDAHRLPFDDDTFDAVISEVRCASLTRKKPPRNGKSDKTLWACRLS